jgi:hypothetical protein
MHRRLATVLHTVFVVAGALGLGLALRATVISGDTAVTAPVTVLLVGGGLLALAIGYRIDVPDEERLDPAADASEQSRLGATLDAVEGERSERDREGQDG